MTKFQKWVRALRHDRRGNVLMMTGFAIIPLVGATGMGIDYARAARVETKLNAAADAAALAAVSKPMSLKTDDEAKAYARAVFLQQVATIPGLQFNAADLNINVAHTSGVSENRTVSVSYSAQSPNLFGRLLGLETLQLGGTAGSAAARQPDIDFYLVLDTSPSMALPATQAGIKTMTDKTGGCAFACHQTDLSGTDTVKDANGNNISYYTYARSQNLVLRTDLVKEAVKDVADLAVTTAAANNATYRFALAEFNMTYTKRVILPSAPSVVKTDVDNVQLLAYCRNSQRVCGVNDDDTASNFAGTVATTGTDGAFAGALAHMPTVSGTGTRTGADTPQAMLFIVTDGMRDEKNSGRKMGPIPTAQCNTIKNRGIKIAILYTEYLPEAASDSWSIANIRTPYLTPTDKISPPLINCASPGLYFKVTTGSNVSEALQTLFKQAVANARLTQ